MAGSDFTTINQAVADLVTQVAATETTEAGATAAINKQAELTAKAVADALTADDAADQGSITAATTAINAVRDRLLASAKPLGDAIANVPA